MGAPLPGTTPVKWSSEPEKTAWMEAHAGLPATRAEVIEGFEREFGIRLTAPQVSFFRAKHDLARKPASSTAHRRDVLPVGTERERSGYVYVKVADEASRAQSKDNWALKQRLVWEEAHGEALPDGAVVMFANGDTHDFAPENLVAVPRELVGVINSGPGWHDRESLEAAVSVARLRRAATEAASAPRRCGVCGREFVPDGQGVGARLGSRTCRECLDKGLFSPKEYRARELACPVCGKAFTARNPHATYCCAYCRHVAQYRRKKGREL